MLGMMAEKDEDQDSAAWSWGCLQWRVGRGATTREDASKRVFQFTHKRGARAGHCPTASWPWAPVGKGAPLAEADRSLASQLALSTSSKKSQQLNVMEAP